MHCRHDKTIRSQINNVYFIHFQTYSYNVAQMLKCLDIFIYLFQLKLKLVCDAQVNTKSSEDQM